MTDQTPEQTPDDATTAPEDDQREDQREDQAPEQEGPAQSAAVHVGQVVTYDAADTYGNHRTALGLVVELFIDSRQQLDGTWTEPQLVARVAQLPDAGVFPVDDLNRD